MRKPGFYWTLGAFRAAQVEISWWGYNPLAEESPAEPRPDEPFQWWGIADEIPGDDDGVIVLSDRLEPPEPA